MIYETAEGCDGEGESGGGVTRKWEGGGLGGDGGRGRQRRGSHIEGLSHVYGSSEEEEVLYSFLRAEQADVEATQRLEEWGQLRGILSKVDERKTERWRRR
jgi:hypothetical protein